MGRGKKEEVKGDQGRSRTGIGDNADERARYRR